LHQSAVLQVLMLPCLPYETHILDAPGMCASGAIVGGVVGGVAGASAIVGIFLFSYCRHKRRAATSPPPRSHNWESGGAAPNPFQDLVSRSALPRLCMLLVSKGVHVSAIASSGPRRRKYALFGLAAWRRKGGKQEVATAHDFVLTDFPVVPHLPH